MRNAARGVVAVFVGLGVAVWAPADSIAVDGKEYTDVLVREGRAMYYVQVPEEGRVLSVRKDAVDPGSVVITPDAVQRQALLDEWKASRPTPDPPLQVSLARAKASLATRPKDAAAAEEETPGTGKRLVLRGKARTQSAHASETRGGSGKSDGYVTSVKLKDAPLGEALKAVLRPMNLDYEVRGNHLFISSPERLRKEADAPVETRTYSVSDFGDTALPKIVLRNPAPVTNQALAAPRSYGAATPRYGGTRAFGGFPGGYGAVPGGYGAARGARTAGAYGGGGYRGYGAGGYGAGGYGAGGYGAGGYGAGGYGGYGGGGSDVTTISNISDLFSTIDDRLVGEPLAVIGYSFHQPSR